MTQTRLVQELDPQLAAAVDRLLARYGWALLSRDEFLRRLCDHVAGGAFRDAATAAFNLYTLTLYSACSGAEGLERQEQAYRELSRFLYDIAYRRYGERSADLVDETLSDIFEHFGDCRKPGAFLAFAAQRLRNLLKQRWCTRFVSIDENEDLLPRQIDVELDHVIAAELRERVARCRELFLIKHKRARLQFEAVWMKHILRLDDVTIGARLGKEPRQVYVLRCRGIDKLRREPVWQALAADLGLPLA